MNMDQAIRDGKFNAWFTLTDNKDFEGAYSHFLDMVDGEIEGLSEEDLMSIKMELVIGSGDLITKLTQNPTLDLEEYFRSINLDVNLENLDVYAATEIYKAVYDAEEKRCEKAMVDQFGLMTAARRGYISKSSLFLNENGDPNAGTYAGVSMAALVLVGLASFGARKIGHRDGGSAEKKAPLVSESNTNYQLQTEKMEPESQDIELCWQPQRVIRNITFHHGTAV